MALTRTVPPRAVALVSAAAAGGTALVGTGLPVTAAATPNGTAAANAATTHAAASTLITLTVAGVPTLSLNAFEGSYATSTMAQNGGDNSADGSQDPTGVLDRVTLDQPAQSKTHSDPAKNWADAQPAVEYSLHGKKLYSISSVDSHAECVPASTGATTYVHTAPDSVTVLGTNLTTGKTTLPVTGAQLGVTGVDHGSLEVTYSTTAAQEQQTSATSAHAHLDLSISGVFYDKAGKQLYSGLVQKLRLGDVQVACQSSGTASPSPTPSPTGTQPTPGSPITVAGNPPVAPGPGVGPEGPAVVEGEDGGPDSATYVPAAHQGRHSAHKRSRSKSEPGAGGPAEGPALPAANVSKAVAPDNGDGSIWWALLSVLGLGGGTGLYFATRRGRGRHQ
ncbi:hypothetical protein KGQ20_12075 [Catenulispora sp. NF23]|uniref:hypothetical protein n=1 Tax=Catenulispora pinistramenti TaxID=2705254 RepID=UPI001BA5C155|nr:hypothetical protein [Catenulispora pinistramenti]MBS2533510.1 hypothetical protein [Catenulispora pinistramenti]